MLALYHMTLYPEQPSHSILKLKTNMVGHCDSLNEYGPHRLRFLNAKREWHYYELWPC